MKKVKKSILLEDELIDEVLRKFISCTKNIIPRPVKEHVLHKKCNNKKDWDECPFNIRKNMCIKETYIEAYLKGYLKCYRNYNLDKEVKENKC